MAPLKVEPMPIDPQQTVYYKRARFTTRLPLSHRYDPSHFWLAEETPGVWRIGLTKFATRMLGDLVECRLNVASGERVIAGQTVGSIEGFKAVSDIYCVAKSEFAGGNIDLEQDPTLLDRDPYDGGWLYRVRGSPTELATDVAGYVDHLNRTIDRMLEQSQEQMGKSC
jgi:glycine cleavage system H protein